MAGSALLLTPVQYGTASTVRTGRVTIQQPGAAVAPPSGIERRAATVRRHPRPLGDVVEGACDRGTALERRQVVLRVRWSRVVRR